MLHFQFPGAESIVEGGVSKLATVCPRSGGSPLRWCVVCVGFRLADGRENRHGRTESHHGSVWCAAPGISWVHSAIRSAHKIPLRCKASTGRIHWTMKTEPVKSRDGPLNHPDARSPFFPEPVLVCFKAEPADSEPITRGVFRLPAPDCRTVFSLEVALPRCIGMSQYLRNRRTCHGSRCPGKDTDSLQSVDADTD
jgi:hypothetical protein